MIRVPDSLLCLGRLAWIELELAAASVATVEAAAAAAVAGLVLRTTSQHNSDIPPRRRMDQHCRSRCREVVHYCLLGQPLAEYMTAASAHMHRYLRNCWRFRHFFYWPLRSCLSVVKVSHSDDPKKFLCSAYPHYCINLIPYDALCFFNGSWRPNKANLTLNICTSGWCHVNLATCVILHKFNRFAT